MNAVFEHPEHKGLNSRTEYSHQRTRGNGRLIKAARFARAATVPVTANNFLHLRCDHLSTARHRASRTQTSILIYLPNGSIRLTRPDELMVFLLRRYILVRRKDRSQRERTTRCIVLSLSFAGICTSVAVQPIAMVQTFSLLLENELAELRSPPRYV